MKPQSRFSEYQIMWTVVFFDLPTETKQQRKDAARFRKFLVGDGFAMFQFSIYVRHSPSYDSAKIHINRVEANAPPLGHICILQLTDKQFSEIRIISRAAKAPVIAPSIQLELF